jgi:hypothetical protein
MRPDELFEIDVAAEVATLCAAQLQGPWQVPAEVVRLANARGAARVDIERRGRGFALVCDGVLATHLELEDLVEITDEGAERRRRQAAVSRMESAGLSVLLWAAGLPGARLKMLVISGGGTASLSARDGRIELTLDKDRTGPPRTTISWRCRGLSVRRAGAWLRTATRFVPIAVSVFGRAVDRGFRDGLYRMRIRTPLHGEMAVTASGDSASLWLLENGVLSARAVIPGYPPFSAAVEMSEIVPAGASADELRQAASPYLEGLIDEAARMLALLVDRLPSVDEPIRARLTTLLLRFALRGVRRDQIMASKVIRVRRGLRRWMESPLTIAGWADRSRGVLRAIEPNVEDGGSGVRLVEATTEERALLSEILGLHIERVGGPGRVELGPRLRSLMTGFWKRIRGVAGPPGIGISELTPDERGLVEAWSAAGLDFALSRGHGAARLRGSTVVIGRDRPEARAAVSAVAENDEWIYPTILAFAGDLDIPDEIQDRWRTAASTGFRSGF